MIYLSFHRPNIHFNYEGSTSLPLRPSQKSINMKTVTPSTIFWLPYIFVDTKSSYVASNIVCSDIRNNPKTLILTITDHTCFPLTNISNQTPRVGQIVINIFLSLTDIIAATKPNTPYCRMFPYAPAYPLVISYCDSLYISLD